MATSHAWCAALLVLAGCGADPGPRQSALDAMKSQCVNDMVASTCRVMQGPSRAQIPGEATTVLVAGLGPIDASLYRQLREQGDSMCQHVVTVCERDWQGGSCQAARRLYGQKAL
ncbi:hypothetical protein OPU71_00030 [Niveibacterium sp. 24ML]|uniref:hypothetical protein n=1 Tax=Niveibacterium sp. 24ML TaxID=2985512 RepID=UPI00226F2291|nr:hypothetical protein [Niveibacterium sp. 24ML]MCX9154505.1 hypothetical protein [Niveibacterium sp. 24ML]